MLSQNEDLIPLLAEDDRLTGEHLRSLSLSSPAKSSDLISNPNCPSDLADQITAAAWATEGPQIFPANGSGWVNEVVKRALAAPEKQFQRDIKWKTALEAGLEHPLLAPDVMTMAYGSSRVLKSDDAFGALVSNIRFPGETATKLVESALRDRSLMPFRTDQQSKFAEYWLTTMACNPGVSNDLRLRVLQSTGDLSLDKSGTSEPWQGAGAPWTNIVIMVTRLDEAGTALGDSSGAMSTELLRTVPITRPVEIPMVMQTSDLADRLHDLGRLTQAEFDEVAVVPDPDLDTWLWGADTPDGAARPHGAEEILGAALDAKPEKRRSMGAGPSLGLGS